MNLFIHTYRLTLTNLLLSRKGKICLLLPFLFLAFNINTYAQFDEYEKKAGMIYTFAKYVNWPNKAFGNDNKLVLGILGDDPFGEIIDNLLKNRPVNGRQWIIRRGKTVRDLKGSHIIFVTNSFNDDDVRSMLDEIYSKNNSMVLTIGDNIDNFCRYGGIINLTPNLLYALNVVAANKAQLTVDVKLLRLASDIVPYDSH